MRARAVPAESPPLSVVLPPLLLAPAGLIAGGAMLAFADGDTLVAINAPHTVAVTHAVAVGWASTTVMGASYQLVQAVLGGRLGSYWAARAQATLHLLATLVFIISVYQWDTMLMAISGSVLAAAFLVYAVLALAALKGTTRGSPVRYGMLLGVVSLLATFGMGLTWVLTLYWAWFPITLGMLSSHAHLGLVGWLGLTILGVSEQLVPMFSLTSRPASRMPKLAITLSALGLAVFFSVIAHDPGPWIRVLSAVLLVPGPALWAWDILRGFRVRSRRKLDIHGRATLVAIASLAAAAIVGMGAAIGTPFTSDEEPARWLLAYGALLLGGFMGSMLVGNSLKIVPFMVWLHRYRTTAGRRPVPVIADMVQVPLQHVALAFVSGGSFVVAAGALLGSLEVVRAGGALLGIGGMSLMGALWWSLLPARSSRQPLGGRTAVS